MGRVDIGGIPAQVLALLLTDKTKKRWILWATNAYASYGEGYFDTDEMTPARLLAYPGLLQPRTEKSTEAQSARTRARAEVFTPAWLCNRMIDALDADWFGRPGVFTRPAAEGHWERVASPIDFPKNRRWQQYVDLRHLEITCGEAPYLVSRYDAATGAAIPIKERIGIVDRKLRIVGENATSREEWEKWAFRAFESSYGYEYQGDNLFLARLNLYETFRENYEAKWGEKPPLQLVEKVANRIAWNVWQMDGLTGRIPLAMLGAPVEIDLFAQPTEEESVPDESALFCRIYDWRRGSSFEFHTGKGKRNMGKKLFDYVIGNPPYQEEVQGTSDKPVYNLFMQESYKCSDKVELITPARFLFNAGKTPKEWNQAMLADPHLEVLQYMQNSGTVFPSTDIKGGVAITYRDTKKTNGPIEAFSPFEELRTLRKKVEPFLQDGILPNIMYLQNKFDLQKLYADYPNAKDSISSDGRERRIVTSSFNKLDVFHNEKIEGEAIQILGLTQPGNKRAYKWILRRYIEDNGNLEGYKVIFAKIQWFWSDWRGFEYTPNRGTPNRV